MSSKTPWTPGPLVVDGFADCQFITKDVPVAIGRPIGIANVYGPNMIADARLFAAAPEMADELAKAIEIFEGDLTGAEWKNAWRSWCTRNRALLSRIEGGEA